MPAHPIGMPVQLTDMQEAAANRMAENRVVYHHILRDHTPARAYTAKDWYMFGAKVCAFMLGVMMTIHWFWTHYVKPDVAEPLSDIHHQLRMSQKTLEQQARGLADAQREIKSIGITNNCFTNGLCY